jgi:hypothetical protein
VARLTVSTAQLASLERAIRGFVRVLRRLAFAAAAVALLIALLLWRDDGFDGADALLVLLLLAPAAIVLFFTRGVLELVSLPGRLQRVPGESQEQIAELTRIAGDARAAKARNAPFLLWRLRGTTGSLRDLAGVAFSYRVFTPAFLTATALSALACIVIIAAGLIALVVTVLG